MCKSYGANASHWWAIAQLMPTRMHKHRTEYNLDDNTLKVKIFRFIQVVIETPEHLKIMTLYLKFCN